MWNHVNVHSIQLYRNPEKIPSGDHIIVQEYLDKPFLIDGFKCDMRIYVLVTACDPLRVFLFHDGLLRLSTEKYLMPSDSNLVSMARYCQVSCTATFLNLGSINPQGVNGVLSGG